MVILSIYLVELSIAGNFFSFFRYPNSSSYSAQDMSAIGGQTPCWGHLQWDHRAQGRPHRMEG